MVRYLNIFSMGHSRPHLGLFFVFSTVNSKYCHFAYHWIRAVDLRWSLLYEATALRTWATTTAPFLKLGWWFSAKCKWSQSHHATRATDSDGPMIRICHRQLFRRALQLKEMNSWIDPTVKQLRNYAMHVLHNFWGFNIGKHQSFLLGPIQSSSHTTKELHDFTVI